MQHLIAQDQVVRETRFWTQPALASVDVLIDNVHFVPGGPLVKGEMSIRVERVSRHIAEMTEVVLVRTHQRDLEGLNLLPGQYRIINRLNYVRHRTVIRYSRKTIQIPLMWRSDWFSSTSYLRKLFKEEIKFWGQALQAQAESAFEESLNDVLERYIVETTEQSLPQMLTETAPATPERQTSPIPEPSPKRQRCESAPPLFLPIVARHFLQAAEADNTEDVPMAEEALLPFASIEELPDKPDQKS